jgi:hypothetical protein
MIHHFLTEEEKIHLNELHRVEYCTTCKFFESESLRCYENKIIVYEDKHICEKYVKNTYQERINNRKRNNKGVFINV